MEWNVGLRLSSDALCKKCSNCGHWWDWASSTSPNVDIGGNSTSLRLNTVYRATWAFENHSAEESSCIICVYFFWISYSCYDTFHSHRRLTIRTGISVRVSRWSSPWSCHRARRVRLRIRWFVIRNLIPWSSSPWTSDELFRRMKRPV